MPNKTRYCSNRPLVVGVGRSTKIVDYISEANISQVAMYTDIHTCMHTHERRCMIETAGETSSYYLESARTRRNTSALTVSGLLKVYW